MPPFLEEGLGETLTAVMIVVKKNSEGASFSANFVERKQFVIFLIRAPNPSGTIGTLKNGEIKDLQII